MIVTVQIELSAMANELITKEVANLNKGTANRRGDKVTTKAKFIANLIDDYYLHR